MADLLLVVPPGVSREGARMRVHPPYGLYELANSISDYQIGILDARLEGALADKYHESDSIRITGLPNNETIQRIKKRDPKVVGISCSMNCDYGITKRLAEEIKSELGLPVIVGGSGVATISNRIIRSRFSIEQCDSIDAVVTTRAVGGGILPTKKLLDHFVRGEVELEEIPGITFRDQSGEPVRNHDHEPDLTNYTYPERRDGLEKYFEYGLSHIGGKPLRFVDLFTSRNCNHNCSYCATPSAWQRRSFRDVSEELDYLKKQRVEVILLEDDMFSGHTREHRAEAGRIVEKISENGFSELYFPNGLALRALLADDCSLFQSIYNASRRMGRVRISFPFESGSDDTLRLAHKPHRLQDIEQILDVMQTRFPQSESMSYEIYLMLGITDSSGKTYESRESIDATAALARRITKLEIDVCMWRCFPNEKNYSHYRETHPDKPFELMMSCFNNLSPFGAYIDEKIAEFYASQRKVNPRIDSLGLRK